MRKVKTNRRNRIFGLFAMFAMAIGVGVSLAPKEAVKTEAALANWVQVTQVSDFVHGEKYLITHGGNSYMKPGAYASSNPSNGTLTLATVAESEAWTFLSTVAGQWRITDGTNYVKIETNTTSGLRTQTSSPSTYFTISIVDNKVRIATSSTGNRAIARYTGGSDWRSYVASHEGSQLDVYKYVAADPGKTLSSIAVTTQPTNKTYFAGESFDKTGMVVMATYSSGSPEDVTDSVVVTPDPLTAGLTSVTVSYTYGSDTKTATVSGLTVTVPSFFTVKYDITAKDTLSESGVSPDGSDADLAATYTSNAFQITSGNSQTLTLTGYTNVKIIEITMSMRSNKSTGAGSFKYSVNDGATYTNIVAGAAFNTASWHGSWSTSYVDVTKTVDIDVQSDIVFVVAATANSLYVESYQFKWEQMEAATLTGLTMNKPTVSIVEEETEQLAVTPVPALAPYDVTWTSNNTAAATVDQTGLVTAVAAGKGTATITATDKTNNSIKATSVVTVLPMPAYDYFGKITDSSKLHFGATYVIASVDGTKAMKYEAAGNNIPAQDTVLKNGEIRGQDVLMKVVLEVGLVKGTYALKTVSTHAESNGKYIYAAGASSNNYLRLQDNITVNSSWLITFEDGVASLVAQNDQSRNVMRFNSTNSPNIFNAYSGGQDDVALFLHQDSVDPVVEAQAFIDVVNDGIGEGAKGTCHAAYDFIDDVFNRLSDDAQLELLYSEEVDAVKAMERYYYLEAWTAANPEPGAPGSVISPNNENSPINATLIIGLLGLTTMAGYYFLSKKEKLVK
jgi:hypothetical protein